MRVGVRLTLPEAQLGNGLIFVVFVVFESPFNLLSSEVSLWEESCHNIDVFLLDSLGL